jgi:hypothetical protein
VFSPRAGFATKPETVPRARRIRLPLGTMPGIDARNFPGHTPRMGTLYYGDNLDILRRYLKDDSVDLVYLNPPFNSAQNYNAFFHEKDGTDAASQIHAFEDTWHWDIETKKACDAVTEQPGKVSDVMLAFYTFLGGNDMVASP